MSHQVLWTKLILERFIEQGNLTVRQERIMRTRAAGYTIKEQSALLGYSVSLIKKEIATLKQIYDIVQRQDPVLPPRKSSAKELYMDEH